VSAGHKKDNKTVEAHFNADMDASLPHMYTLDAGVKVGSKTDPTQLSASLAEGWGTRGSFSHKFNNKLTLKSDFQINGKELFNVEVQRKGVDCCHAAKWSFLPAGHKLTASYMQSLTRFVSVGGHLEVAPTGNGLTGALRYKRMFKGPAGEKSHHGHTAAASVDSEGNFAGTYTRQLDLHTTLATELTKTTKEWSTSVAALLNFQTFNFQAKLTPDSGLVSGYLEHKYHSALSLLFSGQYNQWTGDSKFGMGIKLTIPA